MFLGLSFDHYFVSFVYYRIILKFILKKIKFILSNMSIAIPYFFWFSFAWNAFFQPLIFSLHVSLDLKLISCRHHTYGLVFVSI